MLRRLVVVLSAARFSHAACSSERRAAVLTLRGGITTHAAAPRRTATSASLTRENFANRHVHARMSEEADKPGDHKSAEPKNAPRDLGDRLDALLDRSFFDPTSEGRRGEPRFLIQFREMFAADPEFASTLYVGCYFALLLFFAQQGVRIFRHCYFMPDQLCPWDVGPSMDALLNF